MSGLLHSQFSSVEETFLTSIIEGLPAMESFAHSWSGLQLTLEEGIKQQILDEETLSEAYVVACRVKTMAELFMDSVSFQSGLAPLFANLSVDGQSSSPSHPTPPKPGLILMIYPVRSSDYFLSQSSSVLCRKGCQCLYHIAPLYSPCLYLVAK